MPPSAMLGGMGTPPAIPRWKAGGGWRWARSPWPGRRPPTRGLVAEPPSKRGAVEPPRGRRKPPENAERGELERPLDPPERGLRPPWLEQEDRGAKRPHPGASGYGWANGEVKYLNWDRANRGKEPLAPSRPTTPQPNEPEKRRREEVMGYPP